VAEAIETVESHLHPVSSFDLDDHPMPNGREEIWRFTPLKRLKGVLDDAPTVGDGEESYAATYELVGPEEYFPGTLSPAEAPRGTALVPDDRASAVASKNTEHALHVKIPAETELSEPIDWAADAATRTTSSRRVTTPSSPTCSTTAALACTPETSRSSSVTAPT
jgi:Fe-S cluster assembly protein SufD